MVFDASARLSSTRQSAPERAGFATCPSCHSVDAAVTATDVDAGAGWRCARCGQEWDAIRLATVARYAAWNDARTAAPLSHADVMRVTP